MYVCLRTYHLNGSLSHTLSPPLSVVPFCALAFQGLGTDDDTLIRVMVSRCEVDMVEIKREFMSNYHKSLGSSIQVGSCIGTCAVCTVGVYRCIAVS